MTKKKKECCCEEEIINEGECSCNDNCNCGDDCNCNEEEILVLKNTIENLNEKIMLSQAELINYRKRKDEETSNLLKYANMDIILEILPVIDNFERALKIKNDNPEFDKFIDGFKLLYSHLVDTLKNFGVEEIITDNCMFDPNMHEALMVGEDSTKENDIILEVFSKGYILKGRVIRPAKVKVNKID